MSIQTFNQLNPPIPLRVIDRGDGHPGCGQAIACIDYSKEDDLIWVIVMDDDGEVWGVLNKNVRGFKNSSIGRSNEQR